MNRLEEFEKLQYHFPKQLDDVVDHEIKHYYQYQKRKKYLYKPLLMICLFFISMITVFNIFPQTAYACKGIPLLENFAKSFSFDQTVKDCIENEYAVYLNQKNKGLILQYMIVDENQCVFYIQNNGINNIDDLHFIAGEEYVSSVSFDGDMIKIQFIYDDLHQITFFNQLKFKDKEEYCFDIPLEKIKIKASRQIILNQKVNVDKQVLLIDKIVISPSIANIYIKEDKNNSLELSRIDFSIEADGVVYDNQVNGVSGKDLNNEKVFVCKSPYFQNSDYKLYIEGVTFISSKYDHCNIDIQKKDISLPEDVKIKDFRIKNDKLLIQLEAPFYKVAYPLVTKYKEDDKEIDLENIQFSSLDDKMIVQSIEIPYSKDKRYALDIDYQQYYSVEQKIKIN